MDDKQKIFWNLDILVKMCRSKSDGPSLRVEQLELLEKVSSIDTEIEEIKTQSEEDEYDTSAEMADRNIEIITKRQLQTLRNNLKEKSKQLEDAKEAEAKFYNQEKLLREDEKSCEDYVFSMQERINESIDQETNKHYEALINETKNKIEYLKSEIETQTQNHSDIQNTIIDLTDKINSIEEEIDKKKKLLVETQANLENKDNYIDKTKKEKTAKRIEELLNKKEKLQKRLEEIEQDPQYISTKIKDIINEKQDVATTQEYFAKLVNIAIHQPYMNVPTNNALEEELLRATQIRDSFANEIDQKNYNILESDTPERVRTEYLKQRISEWEQNLDEIKSQVFDIDRDIKYQFRIKEEKISDMIKSMESELVEYYKAYEDVPDSKIGTKATFKVAYDEKKDDLIAAKHILQSFRKDESDEIEKATYLLKTECTNIANNIKNAFNEMEDIKNRLLSKKSGAIDIASQNKDKDKLKELAQIVIDIKHRRQFSETPIEITHRLEEILAINITDFIDNKYIEETKTIIPKDFSQSLNNEKITIVEASDEPEGTVETLDLANPKRGLKVLEEAEIANAEELLGSLNTQENIPDESKEDESDDDTNNSNDLKGNQTNEVPETQNDQIVSNEEDYSKKEVALPLEEKTTIDESFSTEKEIIPITEETTPSVNDTGNNSATESSDKQSEQAKVQDEPVKDQANKNVEEITPTEQNIDHQEEPKIKKIKENQASENNIEKNNKNITSEEKYDSSDLEIDNSDDLSINSIFNNKNKKTKSSKNVNIVSSENLANELDEYINNLGDNDD